MKKYKKFIFIGVLVVFNLYIVFFTNYKCPWRRDFNIYCAGCGGTRMLRSLMKLDFYQAFRYNALIFILVPLVFIYVLYVIIKKILGRCYYKIKDRDLIILFLVMLLFMTLRNIEAFSFLTPTKVR